ncbi:DEAD DEAH box helicase family protein [Cryptosporidium andersoni]|uniref:RNA helicase n=1 Tax=Cryptosporidium andersoni TaxID=117008 RepID=A0A1J4MT42_9CRYT|nr:DEAD DEAH box helicase family protein [Cryptosporidium andersoni]
MLRLGDLQRLDEYEGDKNYLETDKIQIEQIKSFYIGQKKRSKALESRHKRIFQFEWDTSEDTLKNESNILYKNRLEPNVAKVMRIEGNQPSNTEVSDTHWSYKKRGEMTARDWRIFQEDHSISTRGSNIPDPIRNWSECEDIGIPTELLSSIKHDKPTSIQMQCIPIGIQMRDLIGIAETGSGKTLAFLLPLLSYVYKLPLLNFDTAQDGPYGLILAPARELALQIELEAQKLLKKDIGIRTLSIVGGRSVEKQAFELRRGVEIIIATPGRMRDCLEKSLTVLTQCNYVILDEADRMVDMGFEDCLNYILDQIPTNYERGSEEGNTKILKNRYGYRNHRITQMFSATMQSEVEKIARKYLKFPLYVTIGDIGSGKKSIQQILNFISENKKQSTLINVLNNYEYAIPPIIIFVNQKKTVDIVCRSIASNGFKVIGLHGGKIQEQRENNLNLFRNGIYDILVATDVAGRGIDIANVNLVINYDVPSTIDTYTHRIGRTGRAGKSGVAISFVTQQDSNLFSELKRILISTNNIVPAELNNI